MARLACIALLWFALFWCGVSLATRQRMAIEQFELSSLSYWLFVQTECGPRALILDPSKYLHSVGVGDYIGSSEGKIQKITPESIEVVELRSDGNGGWSEVPTDLRSIRVVTDAEAKHAEPGCDPPSSSKK